MEGQCVRNHPQSVLFPITDRVIRVKNVKILGACCKNMEIRINTTLLHRRIPLVTIKHRWDENIRILLK
jgi:hypothetical protein